MLEIISLPLSAITPFKNNAKLHPQAQVEQIKRSISEFGMNDPIAIDENNTIIEGHGRLLALKQMGASEVPCIRLSHLSESQKRAYILSHNKLTLNSGFDMDLLASELDFLRGESFDVALTGFDAAELDDIFSGGLKDKIKDDEFDVDGELAKPAVSRPGDVWTLGRHRLVCGDSTKPETYAPLMRGEPANLCVTDPPYNVNYQSKAGKIKNDNMTDEAFYRFLYDAFFNAANVMANDASIYVFHSDSEGLIFRRAFDDAGFYLSGTCIWKKQSLVLGRSPYHWQHEPVLFGWKKKGKHGWYSDRKQSTIWEFDKPKKNADHPTMKPVPLIAYPIMNSSLTNSIVLDPFGGSGSTLIACEQTGRVCRTIELDEKYCDVIVRRFLETAGSPEGIFVERGGVRIPYPEVNADG